MGPDKYRRTHSGSDPAWGPENARPRGQDGSPVQTASPGRWESFPGDLDPSSIAAGAQMKTCHSEQLLKLRVV